MLGDPAGFSLPKRLSPLQGYIYPVAKEADVKLASNVRPALLGEVLDTIKDGEAAYEDGQFVVAKGDGLIKKEVHGFLIKGPWELQKSLLGNAPDRSSVMPELPPNVSIDEKKGPVIIDRDVLVDDFVKIEGPTIISSGSRVSSFTRISGSYIGIRCRVGGEVERSIIDGYSNKPHYGFLGDSYVGMYVNIGAGATTSNLKNTYGTVRVNVDGFQLDTGEAKVGAFIGDYSRISINTSIMAGRIIGPASYVSGNVDSDVPPFMFYGAPIDLERFIEQAERFLKRRGLSLSSSVKEVIALAYKELNATPGMA